MITHSLDNLLLDDEPLDDQPLLGPVVPMRWMSNLFRLAFLEETDRQLLADGLDLRHQAEIRRLRRTSMAPAVGRFYPVGGEPADAGQNILPEQARHLVELWRSRQPVPSDDPESEFLDDDDPEGEYLNEQSRSNRSRRPVERKKAKGGSLLVQSDERDIEFPDEQPRPRSDERRGRPRAVVSYPYDFEETDFDDSDEWSAGEFHEQGELGPSLAARFTPFAAIMLLAALLGVAATWFVNARIQPTLPHSAPAGILSTTKIAPSAVPRNSVSSDAVGVLVSRNTKH